MDLRLSRRNFMSLAGAAALSAVADAKPEHDPCLTLVFSDVHLGEELENPYYDCTRQTLTTIIDEVLALRPLPARAVMLGDIAQYIGKKGDYEASRPYLKRIEDAGIPITFTLGNHDKRKHFFEAYPEYREKTLVPGCAVTVTHTPHLDILLLDSLWDGPDVTKNNNPNGFLPEPEQKWIAENLPKWPRPVLVGAHHHPKELRVNGKPIAKLLWQTPNLVGWLHGHWHLWSKTWLQKSYFDPDFIRVCGVPTTGYHGDIGYCLLRTEPGIATVSLHQQRFCSGLPPPAAPHIPSLDMVEENKGQYCRFRIPQA